MAGLYAPIEIRKGVGGYMVTISAQQPVVVLGSLEALLDYLKGYYAGPAGM